MLRQTHGEILGNIPPDIREQLHLLSLMIYVGCTEKKTAGYNHLHVTSGDECKILMKYCGIPAKYWLGYEWSIIPMKLLNWKDINIKSVSYNRMIVFGCLYNKLPNDIVKLIIGYTPPQYWILSLSRYCKYVEYIMNIYHPR